MFCLSLTAISYTKVTHMIWDCLLFPLLVSVPVCFSRLEHLTLPKWGSIFKDTNISFVMNLKSKVHLRRDQRNRNTSQYFHGLTKWQWCQSPLWQVPEIFPRLILFFPLISESKPSLNVILLYSFERWIQHWIYTLLCT